MLLFQCRVARSYIGKGLIALILLCIVYRMVQLPIHSSNVTKSRPLASVIIKPNLKSKLSDEEDKSDEHVYTEKLIPKIIHQTWKTHYIPELMEKWVKSWMKVNPDWEYWFWTDRDIKIFVEERFPQYLELFNSYPESGYRADAFRYFLLYEYGGVYADLDMEAVRPLDSALDPYNCVVSQEPLEHAHFLSPMGVPLVSNAFMACQAKHRFFGHVIGDLSSYAGLFKWNDILKATGPYMLTEIYRGYSRNGLIFSAPSGDDTVHLADPQVFQPTTDQSMRDHMHEACRHSEGKTFLSNTYLKWQKKLCTRIMQQGFVESPTEKSVTDHHWTHTWGGRKADPWGIYNNPRTFDVRTLAKKT